jgi:hypothetical protein
MVNKQHVSPADSKMEYGHITMSKRVAYSRAKTVDGGK